MINYSDKHILPCNFKIHIDKECSIYCKELVNGDAEKCQYDESCFGEYNFDCNSAWWYPLSFEKTTLMIVVP